MDGFGGGAAGDCGLSQRESVEWCVTSELLQLDQLPKVSLRINIQASESCPENMLSYQTVTAPFQVNLIDLFIPDLSAVCHTAFESQILSPFAFALNSMPYALSKKCISSGGHNLFDTLVKRLNCNL